MAIRGTPDTSPGGGAHGKITNKKILGNTSQGGGGTPVRPTVGKLWPRGERGK